MFLFEKTHQERNEKWYILYMIPEMEYKVNKKYIDHPLLKHKKLFTFKSKTTGQSSLRTFNGFLRLFDTKVSKHTVSNISRQRYRHCLPFEGIVLTQSITQCNLTENVGL